MNDSAGVRRVERVCDLNREVQQNVIRQRTAANAVAQRLTFEQFHYEKALPVLFADIVQDADSRMVQSRNRTCLAMETTERQRILSQILRKEFQRNHAAKARVFRSVHVAHAAAAELFD